MIEFSEYRVEKIGSENPKILRILIQTFYFARKVQLIQHQTPDKQVSGLFISPEASEEVKQCCAEYDLTFVG